MKKMSFLIVTLLVGSHIQAHADATENFYKGKTVRIVVGVAPGSGYDLNARALAKYMGKYLPGHPTFVVQNQPGSGSITMTNTICNAGPFDGTVIGASFGGIPTAALFTPSVARFDPLKINWLGTTNQETHVGYVWHTSPVQSFDDVFKTQLMVGAQAPGVTQYDFPKLANALLGTKFKVISGYESTPAVHSAMERGEVQGVGASGWVTLKLLNSDWIKNGSVKPIIQWGLKKNPDLPNVPMVLDYAKSAEDKAAFKLMFVRLAIGRPFFMPPNTPPDRVAAMRKAFDAVMKDKGFIADETRLKLDVVPLNGDEVLDILKEAYKTPPAVVERLRKILNTH
jgi:tripartite-type tricarboxylate transporter receptor subunit TctC